MLSLAVLTGGLSGATSRASAAEPALPGELTRRSEISFTGTPGMRVARFELKALGEAGFTDSHRAPLRAHFTQAAIYRLCLSNLAHHPGLKLYPTLEVTPANPKTSAFLARQPVPVSFTDRDFKEVVSGNYVVKVVYLPDREGEDQARPTAEVVSYRLKPGLDPITEAIRRGSILAVVRLGNIDLNASHPLAGSSPTPSALPPGLRLAPPGWPGNPACPGPP